MKLVVLGPTGRIGKQVVRRALTEGHWVTAVSRHPDAVTSMIATSPLAELPKLMDGASLFLGNDSGLKHIAAGLEQLQTG